MYKVSKSFEDKFSRKVFSKGTDYVTEDKERAEYLIEKGYLERSNSEGSKDFTLEDVLDQTLTEIKETIAEDTFSKEVLNEILESEKQNKNRKGVIEYIESLIN